MTSSNALGYRLNPLAPTQVNRFASPVYETTSRGAARSNVPRLLNSAVNGSLVSRNYYVHPEGSLIYREDGLVSCQPLTNDHKVLAAHIMDILSDFAGKARVTIYLEIKGHANADYYVVVHKLKQIIWADNQRPKSFTDTMPIKHEHEYWIHMENFPAPVPSTPADRQALISVLASTAVDASTSDGSTSPLSIEQIEGHLRYLAVFGDKVEINQTYAVARLWNMLLQSRVINKFGTPEARLDRFITLSERPPKFVGVYETMSKIMFHTPRAHLIRCSRTWADRIAYTQEWRKLKASNEKEWQQVMHLACVLVIASLLVNSRSTCAFKTLANISLLAGLGSIASVYCLINESQNLGDHASDASVYFQTNEERQYGVQKLAIIHAMPQALLIWGFMFFLASVSLEALPLN